MASFNPSTGASETQAQSNLSFSRGTGPDKTFETLFSGLGDLVGGVAKTTDNAIQNKIEKEARYGYESTNDELNLSTSTVPTELTRTSDGLQKLANAHMQGKVTNEYYYARLASSLKGLRARYPGYESQVDQIVQNVTGVNPANAYRNALLQNIQNQETAAASAQSKLDTWVNQNDAVISIVAPDYFTNKAKYSTPDAVNQLRDRVAQYEGRTRLAEDTVKLSNANKEVARPQLGQYLQTVASGYVVGAGSAADVDSPNVQNLITKALQDGTVSQDEKDSINGFIAAQRAQAEAHMRRDFQTKTWGGNFTSTDREAEVKNALSVFDNMTSLINSDQISQAAQIASRNKAQMDQSVARVYEKYPELQVAGAVRQIAGDQASSQLVDSVVQKLGGGVAFLKTLTPDAKIVSQDGTKAVVSGNMTVDQMSDAFLGMGGKSKTEKEAMVAATLNATTSVLSTPGVDPNTLKNTVRNTYSTKLDGIWSKVDNTTGSDGLSQRARLFNKMFSPEITKQIAALNDPESMDTYTAAAVDKFQQIPEFRRAAASLSKDLPYARYAEVSYDPNSNKIVMNVNRQALQDRAFFTRSDEQGLANNLVPFVSSLNQALSVMAPIIEASNQNEAEGVASLMSQLNLNFNEGKKTGIFGYINDRLEQMLFSDQPQTEGRTHPGRADGGNVVTDILAPIQNATEGFRNEVRSFEEGVGSPTEGRPAGDGGSLPIGPGDVLRGIQNSTEGFRDNLRQTEQSLGSETQGRPAGDGQLPVNPPDVLGAIQGSTESFRNNLQATERSLGSETQGRGAFEALQVRGPVAVSDEVINFDLPLTEASASGRIAARDVVSGLASRGIPQHVAQGIVMNFRDESGLRTDVNEQSPTVAGSRGGYGLAQWTGPRRRALERYAESRGEEVSSLETQLDFLIHELTTTESGTLRRLASAETAGEAARIFLNHFERPAERHRARRERSYRD